MTNTAQRIAMLSPERRALLEKRLAQSSAAKNCRAPLVRNGNGIPVPSFGQERLWVLEQIESGTARYNISFTLRLKGTVDVAALNSAFSAVIQRHETLRSRYMMSADGRLQLEFSGAPKFPLSITDFSGIEESKREDLLSTTLHTEANRPIVLDRDPVFRAALYRMGGCEYVLQLTVHHVALDGWSIGVLFRDLAA